MRETLINTYLDYLNSYASIAKYAEKNALDYDQAKRLLELAKVVFNSPHPES